jgi:hypothetical protein
MNKSVVFSAILSVVAPASQALAQFGWAVTTDSKLIHFELSSPSNVLLTRSLSGLRQANGVSADPFGSIYDLAQFNGQLYGLDGYANFYSIDTASGAATFISSGFSPAGFDAGLAYDPFAGKFRFVSDAGENALLAFNGAVTTGGTVYYGAGDPNAATGPAFAGLAIDYDFGTGFALDPYLDTLAVTFDPNFEEFFTVGGLGIDVTGLASLDIFNGALYAALSSDAATSSLYSLNSGTGAATLIGSFAGGITGLAVTGVSAVPEPATYGLLAAGALLGAIVVRRRRAR